MAFRLNIVTIFFLLTAGLVLIASAKESGNSKRKKVAEPTLRPNIHENPFLQPSSSTTEGKNYQGNPFLSPSSKPMEHPSINGKEQKQPESNVGKPFSAGNKGEVGSGAYIHNPFLQGSLIVPNNPINLDASDKLPSRVSKDEPTKENQQMNARSKSEIKCGEYDGQVLGETKVLSLAGSNSEVIKVTNADCITVNSLVVGGTDAAPGEFPHMVALGISDTDGTFNIACGGTLIAPQWVLSAAHCTYGPNGGPTEARIGLHNLKDNHLGITMTIKKIMRHPNYKPPAMYADIAVLKLNAVVKFTRDIRPACLYQEYDTVPLKAWVSGWGVTELAGEQSDVLQKASLDVIDNLACTIRHNRSTAVPHGITPSMICAGDPHGGWHKDTCQGDSGGPLQLRHPNYVCLYQVIGITSFGEGCATINSPGVYTRVSHYLTWIEQIVWPDD